MSAAIWHKEYPSEDHLRRAVAHQSWLEGTELAVAPLRHVDVARQRLIFTRLAGRHATEAADLALVSCDIGRWHARLAQRELALAESDMSLPIDGGELPGFLAVRTEPLRCASAPGALIGPSDLPALAALAAHATTSVYKDLNVRNVLIDGDVVRHVDVDDLTLAPAGYDLAKLLLSWGMIHGRRPAVEDVLDSYNASAGQELCNRDQLAVWLELHHVLTFRYRAIGQYSYAWPALRTPADQMHARALL